MKKRLLSILLAMIMALSILPTTSMAADSVEEALGEIDKIKAALRERRPASLAEWNELRNMLLTAESVTRAALDRKESLGAHCRAD